MGIKIEIPNIGNEISNGERGAVIIIIKEIEHNIFKRTNTGNYDLAVILNISLVESLCGFKRIVNHLDGRKLAIIEEDIIKSGDTKVIKNEGMPHIANCVIHGNLIIKFSIEYPRQILNKNKLYECLEGTHDLDFSLLEDGSYDKYDIDR